MPESVYVRCQCTSPDRYSAADHEFLLIMELNFDPRSGSFPGFVRELVRLPTLGSRPLTRPPHTDRQGLPIEERKAKLEALLKKRPKILRNYSDLNFQNEAGSFHCKERMSQSDSSFNIR